MGAGGGEAGARGAHTRRGATSGRGARGGGEGGTGRDQGRSLIVIVIVTFI